MATAGMSYEQLQQQKKALLDLLADTQNSILKTNAVEGAIDIHHPERSAGWPIYRHQEFPKILYHPIKLDPVREGIRLGLRQRNDANPTLAPLDVPPPLPLILKVANKAEQEKAEEEGFVTAPMVKDETEKPRKGRAA